jgi:hypothetical protein
LAPKTWSLEPKRSSRAQGNDIDWHRVNPFLTMKGSPSDGSGKTTLEIITTSNGSFPELVGRWGRRAMPVGAQWSHGMSVPELRAGVNLLSAFALTIGGALGVGLPMTLVIIWVCS